MKATDQVFYGNQPIGTVAAIQAILDHAKAKPKWPEFRQPFCRKPDELDQLQSCYVCGGDKTVLVHGEEEDCGMCGGEGTLPFQENEVFLTVYRDGHSIETLAVVLDNGEVNAFVSLSQPGFPEGKRVLLTDHEKEVARNFFGKPEPHKAGETNSTEENAN